MKIVCVQGACSSIENLSELKTFIATVVDKELPKMNDELVEVDDRLRMLEEFNQSLTHKNFELAWQARSGPKRVKGDWIF